MRLHLVPHRWWPTMPAAVVPPGETSVVFTGLGGPLRKGLVACLGPEGSSLLRIVGRYDLDDSAEITLASEPLAASRLDIPEAACLEPWHDPPTAGERLFFAAMSPIALFWPEATGSASAGARSPGATSASSSDGAASTGVARGFAPHPFLPALIESRSGVSRLSLSSEASEFEVPGLPAGDYRVRALDLFGRLTFASGIHLPSLATAPATRLWAKIDLDEPNSREVVGFVRWENGLPVEKAPVIMQNSQSFRKFVKRVETDEHGFYRFADVPGDEPYFVFAMPPSEDNSMRNFDYFFLASPQREVWHDVTLHPHRVTVSLDVADARSTLQLVRTGGKEERVLWTFHADASGQLRVANVPHGRYRVQKLSQGGSERIRSLPLEVVEGQEEFVVRWPEPGE